MRILSRYLLARFIGLFAAIAAAVLVVISVAEILLHLEDLLEAADFAAGVVRYVGLKLLSVYMRTLVPIVAFAAVFATLGLTARWHETTAIKAGGVSLHRVVAPLLAAATVLSLASFALNETLGIRALREWERRESDGGDTNLVFRRGSFWYHRDRVIYNIRRADPEGNVWRGVTLFELTERGRLRRSIRAEAVRIEPDSRWHFFDVTIRGFDPERPLSPPRFERHEEAVLDMGHDARSLLQNADPSLLALPELWEYVDASRRRQDAASSRARAVLHERLADPAMVLLFALLAVPFGMRVERSRSLAVPALLSVLAVAVVLFSRSLASILVREGVAPAALTSWGLLAVFTALGVHQFARIPR